MIISRLIDLLCILFKKIRKEIKTRKTERKLKQEKQLKKRKSERKLTKENQKGNYNKKIIKELETRKTERKLKQRNISCKQDNIVFKRLIMSFVQVNNLV